jgi:hypothetical protein
MSEKIIIGAGLSGLITACHIPDIPIYEATSEANGHRALLRFRTEAVAQATGIPFREVTVHKAIYYDGETYLQCTPRFANMYASKVLGRVSGDRSIWDLTTARRYIAPEDFQDRLAERHRSRIFLNTPLTHLERDRSDVIISTIPLPTMLRICGLSLPPMSFEASPIRVNRYRLPQGTDVHQTIYFPQPNTSVYRASITGDLLIIECVDNQQETSLSYVCEAFGIAPQDCTALERVGQRYGKITDIQRDARRAILHRLSTEFNVYSIGRFACWRNILLDDIVKDIGIVQRLIAASAYDRRLELAR